MFESCCFNRSGGLHFGVFDALQQKKKMLFSMFIYFILLLFFLLVPVSVYSLSTVMCKCSSLSHCLITSFTSDSSVLQYSMLHFYISLLLTRTNSFSFLHFILMLLQKERGCQFSGLNWCIYSNAIKKSFIYLGVTVIPVCLCLFYSYS